MIHAGDRHHGWQVRGASSARVPSHETLSFLFGAGARVLYLFHRSTYLELDAFSGVSFFFATGFRATWTSSPSRLRFSSTSWQDQKNRWRIHTYWSRDAHAHTRANINEYESDHNADNNDNSTDVIQSNSETDFATRGNV